MTELPEWIWARPVAPYGFDMIELGCWWPAPEYGDEVACVRGDLYETQAAEIAALKAEVRKWRGDAIQANKDALAAEQEAARIRAEVAAMRSAFLTYIRDASTVDTLTSIIDRLDALMGEAKE